MIITICRNVTKMCPYQDEVDEGTLIIVIHENAPELHKLGEDVDDLCREPATHESFTKRIAGLLPSGSHVTTYWRTGPWIVKAEAWSPSGRGRCS